MNINSLDQFIQRYNLNKEIESVLLVSDGTDLSVETISNDRTMKGSVTAKGIEFPKGEFGVYSTSTLRRMIGVLGNEAELEVDNDTLIKFKNGNTSVDFMLSIPSVIPKVPAMKQVPEFDISINMTDQDAIKIEKALKAIAGDRFTILVKNSKIYVVIGHSTQLSDSISIEVEGTSNVSEPFDVSFSSVMFANILAANSISSIKSFNVSSAGLCRIEFSDESFDSLYLLIKLA